MSTLPHSDDPTFPVPGPLPPAASTDAPERLVGQDVAVALRDDWPPQYRRRVWLPLTLFFLTCAMTFLAGCYHWRPLLLGESVPVAEFQNHILVIPVLEIVRQNWLDGLIFMACVMSVLLMHEMGHFLMTIRHRVPASYPYFIPMPVMITGTMGAVISMDGSRANRKELFDIGLAGPLAGLVLTIPMVIIGIMIANAGPVPRGAQHFGDPLLVQLLIPWLRNLPPGHELQVNPIYMAGWVGMLITGLNMLPVSQLDGGHVSYAVLGPFARWLGRGFIIAAVLYIIWSGTINWVIMLVIVILIGVDHPPTADDTVKIGPLRWCLGLASLLIPIFCFTLVPLS